MKQLICLFLLSGLSVQSLAEMYKWIDEEGNVQYTQTPPPTGTPSTTVTGVPTNSISGSQPPGHSSENSQVSNEQSSKEACLKAQNELRILRRGKVVMPDKKNPEKFISMPEEMRRERELETTDYLEKHCKDFALPEETPKKESSECDKVRDYLTQLTSEKDWLIPDPENPEQFIKIDKEARQKKINEAQAFLKETCSKQQ